MHSAVPAGGVAPAGEYLPAAAGAPQAALASAAHPGTGLSGATLVGAGYPEAPGPGAAAPRAAQGREPWLVLRRQRRVRIFPVALAALAVLIVAGGVAGALLALRGGSPKPPTLLPVAASSASPAETGDVWVQYGGGKLASAQLDGTIRGVASGEVARLYGQPFPFDRAAAPVSSRVALHPAGTAATASYAFRVTPTLATRYHVEVFAGAAAPAPLARSKSTIIYVTYSATAGSPSPRACARPVCKEQVTIDVLVPPSAMSTEIAKHWYVYFGATVSSSAAITPPPPATLILSSGDAKSATPNQLSAGVFTVKVTFQFAVGGHGVSWLWDGCTQDTELVDGLGLPGTHGCGSKTVPANASYLG
jgi:hypothetical protein